MANRVVTPNLFAPTPPNWNLQLLDANASNAAGAINDSSLGSVNGPLTDTGSANNYQVTCNYGTPSALNNGMTVFFIPANTNTGPSTLTVSPLSSASIVSTSGSALVGGELAAGTTIGVVCDGTVFKIFNLPSPASIWAVRLRSWNAAGNPNFEVAQRNVGNALTNPASGTFLEDRWWLQGGTSLTGWTAQRVSTALTAGGGFFVPGTNFVITTGFVRFTVTTPTASLSAGQILALIQSAEGPQFRELASDVHSVTLYARSSIANFSFGLFIRDPGATRSLTKLCTLGAANTQQLITLPNLPAFPSAGNFSMGVGVQGYVLGICLACGSTNMSPANDTWQTGNFSGAVGQGNLMATSGATFDLLFIQHEPGSQCTTPIDKPFTQNLDESLRFYVKSYDYGTAVGTASTGSGARAYCVLPSNLSQAIGATVFPKSMAKAPTVTFYNHITGAANSAQDSGGVNHAVTGVIYAGLNSSNGMNFSTACTASMGMHFHYTSDTGW
jgi:hypothetical protein